MVICNNSRASGQTNIVLEFGEQARLCKLIWGSGGMDRAQGQPGTLNPKPSTLNSEPKMKVASAA